MVELNEDAKAYMQKYGWKHIVLNIEEITSWCAPPHKEMSVGFTDEEKDSMLEKSYIADRSELGNVYYPDAGVIVPENITIKYIEYPWITCFETEGIQIIKSDRKTSKNSEKR